MEVAGRIRGRGRGRGREARVGARLKRELGFGFLLGPREGKRRDDRRGGASGAPAPGVPGQPLPPLEWKFSQVFGERAVGEEVQEGTTLTFPVSPC